jgi:hypothetical protein
MSTVTLKKSAITGIDTADMDKAIKLLKVVTPEKMMKKFNRNVNDNVKLDRFLSGEFTVPKAFDPTKLGETINKLVDPKNHEHHGLTNIDQQKLILKLLASNVLDLEILAKRTWMASFTLDDEQTAKAADVLTKYEAKLRKAIEVSVRDWSKVYGA